MSYWKFISWHYSPYIIIRRDLVGGPVQVGVHGPEEERLQRDQPHLHFRHDQQQVSLYVWLLFQILRIFSVMEWFSTLHYVDWALTILIVFISAGTSLTLSWPHWEKSKSLLRWNNWLADVDHSCVAVRMYIIGGWRAWMGLGCLFVYITIKCDHVEMKWNMMVVLYHCATLDVVSFQAMVFRLFRSVSGFRKKFQHTPEAVRLWNWRRFERKCIRKWNFHHTTTELFELHLVEGVSYQLLTLVVRLHLALS